MSQSTLINFLIKRTKMNKQLIKLLAEKKELNLMSGSAKIIYFSVIAKRPYKYYFSIR